MLQMSIQYLPRGMNGNRSPIIGSAGSVGRNNLIATIQPSAGPTQILIFHPSITRFNGRVA